ncbi:hypothetical protein B0H10DRAFT_2028028 [Mycena sp. CBHHK59/15]|nr:hypothetical protein B0H10DRAFT_2028028 [Mycena sp. CBHHK59/15]
MIPDSESSSRSSDDESDWYDPQESERDLEHPKYWSEEDQEVVVGIKQRLEPIKLDTLCGTYHWFYEFPEPGMSEPMGIAYHDPAHDPRSPGYLTITCPPGKRATLKNISGTVVHFGKEARFSGLKRAKDADKKHVDNQWEFVTLKWKEDYGDNQNGDNDLLALEVSDDGGEPFVMFRYASPGMMGHTWYLDIAAKKQRVKDEYGLTSSEMERLGMQAQYPEIKAAALAVVSDDESESGIDADVEEEKPISVKRKTVIVELETRPKKRKLS